MQFLTPDMVARIATVLGVDRNEAQSGISAAVPALLAGLTGVAAKPGGAQSLVEAVKQQSSGLNSFGKMIGGGDQSVYTQKGSQLLTSLLGNQDQSALAGAVGKFAGLGQSGGNSLLAMLAPVAMGIIGKHIGAGNLNAGSLTSLLASQSDQIGQALPAGFGKLLAGTGLLESLGGAASSAAGQAARGATAAREQTAQLAASGARTIGSAGQRAAVPNWIYWAIPLVVALGLIWYMVGQQPEQVAQQAAQPATTVRSVMVGNADVAKQLDDSLGGLRTSLQGITDIASAQAAIPKLQEAGTQVDKINGMLEKLSTDQRSTILGSVKSATASLNQAFDKALAIPGVGEVLRPSINTFRTKLADLSTQPGTVGAGR